MGGDEGSAERGGDGGEAHCSVLDVCSGMNVDPCFFGLLVDVRFWNACSRWVDVGTWCVCAMTMCWNANPVCLLTTEQLQESKREFVASDAMDTGAFGV